MNTKQHSNMPSQKLRELLAKATPEQRAEAMRIAALLLNRRADREATGQTDLTKPFKACTKG